MTQKKTQLILITLFFYLLIIPSGKGQSSDLTISSNVLSLDNFIIKENLLKNDKIAIIACNADEKPLESISGTYQFSINGFKQELKFNEGVAVAPQQIDKSTFIYLRHENQTGTHGKLYYVIKKDDNLRPIKINWLILILLPLGIVLIATLFRKFLIFAVILLVIFLFFNSSNGLSLPTFFDTVVDGLKGLF